MVIEEGLTGPECSLLVLCDGQRLAPLAPAQDFKRRDDDGAGPNTGGMGAYSPVPSVDDALVDALVAEAVAPLVEALRARGIDYRGVLYAGLMLTPTGPKVLEFNVRFGDPETQVVVPRFEGDLAALLAEVAAGALVTTPRFAPDPAVCVVLASEGYPESPRTGDPIAGLDEAGALPGVTVFHAGTDGRPGHRWRRHGRRTGARGDRPRRHAGGGPRPRLRRGGRHRLARHAAPHRHRPGGRSTSPRLRPDLKAEAAR